MKPTFTEGRVALLVIDVQKGLAEASLGQRNNPQAESNMAALLDAWRARQWPVIHIRHCSVEADSPLRPELPGNAFKDEVKPLAYETVFEKTVNSAFIGTGLEQHLREIDVMQLVIVGLTTDHCVSASTRTASDLGFEVILISDATAAFERHGYDGRHYSGDEIHRVNLVSLDGEFCEVRSSAELLATIGLSITRSKQVTNTLPGDGGCQCGNIRYRLNAPPLMLYVCHCSDCQKQSASAFGMSLRMQPQQVEFVQGAESLRSWDTPGDDGRIKRCHFCPHCGTRIMHGSDDPTEDVSIKAGSLDDTSGLQPSAHIWLKSAQPWVSIDRENYACFETEPDARSLLGQRKSGGASNG